MTAVAPVAGRLSDKFGSRVLALVGMGITGISHAVLSFVDAQTSVYLVMICLILNGIGFGLFSSPNANAMMVAVGVADYGRAGSAIAVMRVVGQMSSMAIVTLVFGIFVGPRALDITVFPELNLAIRVCFAFGACLCLVFIAFSYFQLRRRCV
jgi:MFS family permease